MDAPEQPRPFRVCESCGRLTPTNSPWCAECGVASREALEVEVERQDEQRFASAFFARRVTMTWAFLGANVAVFALMVLYTHGVADPSTRVYSDALVRFGSKINLYIDRGDWWRFVTPVFIHVGLVHLAVNMYTLWALGPRVERLYGASRFVVLYLVSGVAGVAASYIFARSPVTSSAGASGALFGLIGVLLVFGLRYRHELPGVFRQAFSVGPVVFMIVLNLWIGYSFPQIDNAAHLGGLAAGAALAGVMPYARRERKAPTAMVVAAVALVALTTAAFGFAWAGGARPDPVYQFIDQFNGLERTLRSGQANLALAASGQLGTSAADEAAQALAVAATEAKSAPGLEPKTRDLFARSGVLLDTMSADTRQAARHALKPEDATALDAETNRLLAEWDVWIAESGGDYGISKGDDKPPEGP